MRCTETAYNAEIDLARGNIERVETDLKTMETHLGGLGTSVRYTGIGYPLKHESVRGDFWFQVCVAWSSDTHSCDFGADMRCNFFQE